MSVLSQGILLFALPYAARKLGAEKFGEFNLATSFSAYASLLGSFGIILYSSRELPRTDRVSEIVDPTVTVRLGLSALAFIIMIVLGLFVNAGKDFFLVNLILGFAILLTSLDVRWVFIAKENMWKISYMSLIGYLAFLAILLILVDSPEKIVPYSIGFSLTLILPALISLVLYTKSYGAIHLSLQYPRWKEMIRESLTLGSSSLLITINGYFAGLLIGIFVAVRDLGYYSAGFRLMMIIVAVYSLLASVVNPAISRLFAQDRLKLLAFLRIYFAVCLMLSIGGSLGLYFSSDWIVIRLFGKEYLRTIVMLKIWALALMPLTPFAIFFASSLIPCNGSKEYLKTLLAGAILTLVVTPILLYEFGVNSIPLSQASIECCNVVLGGFYLKQKLKLDSREFFSMINVRQALRDGRSILFGIDGLIIQKSVPK